MSDALAIVNQYRQWKEEVVDATNEAYKRWGCPKLIDTTSFEWNNRFKNRGADAIFYRKGAKGKIRMSALIWPHFTSRERYELAVHEAAHVAAPYLYLRKSDGTLCENRGMKRIGHGREWKVLMWDMNLEAKRCHDVDTFALGISKRRKKTRYYYACKCPNGVWLGPGVHKQVQNGWQTRKCRTCKTSINQNLSFRKVVK